MVPLFPVRCTAQLLLFHVGSRTCLKAWKGSMTQMGRIEEFPSHAKAERTVLTSLRHHLQLHWGPGNSARLELTSNDTCGSQLAMTRAGSCTTESLILGVNDLATGA